MPRGTFDLLQQALIQKLLQHLRLIGILLELRERVERLVAVAENEIEKVLAQPQIVLELELPSVEFEVTPTHV